MRSQLLAPLFLLLLIAPTFAQTKNTLSKPNVLFIAVDDLNNDLGCYGHSLVKSPNIDKLASLGMLFQNAYCQYPVCNPSRSSFMTGMYPPQTGVLSNGGNFRKRLPNVMTLAQLFKQHGYFVARIGKIFHYGVPLQIGTPGKDDPQSWHKTINPIGVDRTKLELVKTIQKGKYGGTLSWLNIESKDTDHTDGKGASAAVKLLTAHHPKKTGKPFFLAVGFYRPHTPYVAPSKYFDLYPREKIAPLLEKKGDRDDIPPAALADRAGQRELTLAQRKEIIQAYYASITFMDAQLGRILEALNELGLAENTIIVFVSDHGYHLGHHGLWQKGDLFEGSCRVPLIIADPRQKNKGLSTKALAEMVDLYPTLAELCKLPQPKHLKGRSLVPVVNDPKHNVREAALTVAWSRGRLPRKKGKRQRALGYSIRTSRYRYTEWAGGKFGIELYDYKTDPMEYTNLAKNAEFGQVLAQMQRLMAGARKRAK
ncbi:MAG: sulfatase [Gemmataceae bacterium]